MEERYMEAKTFFNIDEQKTKPQIFKQEKIKPKRQDKSDLGDDFVAPDGGWGWVVALASGANILVTFAIAHQFGIIFKAHVSQLGITSSELSTIVSLKIAVSALTGLLNGPMFRRYTFRQVALFGSVMTFVGIFLLAYAYNFITYVLSFSVLYGFGRGLTVSASSLAVNTYFKLRRRTATALQFGVAGLGPILLPYFTNFCVNYFDVQGTVLIFAGISLNTVACSMFYQPVTWHVKKKSASDAEASAPLAPQVEESAMLTTTEPDPRANDGWYGSRLSLNKYDSAYELKSLNSCEKLNGKPHIISRTQSIKEETNEDENPREEFYKNLGQNVPPLQLSEKQKTKAELELEFDLEDERRRKLPFYKKVMIFFDLDLLRDFGYVNIAIGLTLIVFVEINFAILTPFILADFGYTQDQIAVGMSAIAFSDLVIRLLIPLITAKMHFGNKTFLATGIVGMCLGRMVLINTNSFYVMVGTFVFLGISKAFRTVFWNLVLPGYVSLKRLPAAAGLQLLMSGVFSTMCGPIIGLLRDKYTYRGSLIFFNALCVFAIVMWILEGLYRKYVQRRLKNSNEDKKQPMK